MKAPLYLMEFFEYFLSEILFRRPSSSFGFFSSADLSIVHMPTFFPPMAEMIASQTDAPNLAAPWLSTRQIVKFSGREISKPSPKTTKRSSVINRSPVSKNSSTHLKGSTSTTKILSSSLELPKYQKFNYLKKQVVKTQINTPSKLNNSGIDINLPNVTFPRIATLPVTFPSFSVPKITLPNVTLPKINFPSVTLPSVKIPKITFPNVTFPKINFPSVTMPNVKIPKITLPSVTFPKINFPSVTMPSVNLPEITLPNITFPKMNVSSATTPSTEFPKITLPNVTFPKIDISSVTLPSVGLPKITWPEISYPNVTSSDLGIPIVTLFPMLQSNVTPPYID